MWHYVKASLVQIYTSMYISTLWRYFLMSRSWNSSLPCGAPTAPFHCGKGDEANSLCGNLQHWLHFMCLSLPAALAHHAMYHWSGSVKIFCYRMCTSETANTHMPFAWHHYHISNLGLLTASLHLLLKHIIGPVKWTVLIWELNTLHFIIILKWCIHLFRCCWEASHPLFIWTAMHRCLRCIWQCVGIQTVVRKSLATADEINYQDGWVVKALDLKSIVLVSLNPTPGGKC